MDEKAFESLLETARWLRQRRLDRLARLGLRRPRTESAVDVRKIRAITGLSQSKFAELLSIEVSTLRNWEQDRRKPEGPALALLRIAARHPRILRENLETAA